MNVHYLEKFSHKLNLKVLNNISYLHVTMLNIDLLFLEKDLIKLKQNPVGQLHHVQNS
jgi:hypothetical protein